MNFETLEDCMIKKGHTYKLDNIYLKHTYAYKGGIYAFQVCDKTGVIKPPVRAANGFITDHGTRLVHERINELIEV